MELSKAIADLGPVADRMRFLFITVDPERDTPDHLKTYLSNFDARVTGLTGTTAEIAAAAKAYLAYYEKVPISGGYTMNHTANLYLMDTQGHLAEIVPYQERPEVLLAKLRNLVGLSVSSID